MDVFWTRGFEGASVRDLLTAMKINRGSMYDTFGDKRSLFLEAIDHYLGNVTGPIVEGLTKAGSSLDNVRRMLRKVSDAAAEDCRGCLMTNVTVEVAPRDDDVAAIVRQAMRGMENAFREALDRAVAAGELKRSADTRALARFLVNTLQGLVVLGKGKAPRRSREDVIDVAMRALAA